MPPATTPRFLAGSCIRLESCLMHATATATATAPTSKMSSRAGITKKACDGCKIRKIKCGGGQPCQSCFNARIKCTYIRVQQPRGPQKLRATTKFLIDQAQRGLGLQNALPSAPVRGEVLEADHALRNPAMCETQHSSRYACLLHPSASHLFRCFAFRSTTDVRQSLIF